MKKIDISSKDLEMLIAELTKNQPNQKIVKKLMISSGMSYCTDPIVQMSQILAVMNEQPMLKGLQQRQIAKTRDEKEL